MRCFFIVTIEKEWPLFVQMYVSDPFKLNISNIQLFYIQLKVGSNFDKCSNYACFTEIYLCFIFKLKFQIHFNFENCFIKLLIPIQIKKEIFKKRLYLARFLNKTSTYEFLFMAIKRAFLHFYIFAFVCWPLEFLLIEKRFGNGIKS